MTSTPNSTQAAFPSPGKMRYFPFWVASDNVSKQKLQTSPSSSSFSSEVDRDGMFQGAECFWPRGISTSRPRLVPDPRKPQTQPAGPNLPQTCKSTVYCFSECVCSLCKGRVFISSLSSNSTLQMHRMKADRAWCPMTPTWRQDYSAMPSEDGRSTQTALKTLKYNQQPSSKPQQGVFPVNHSIACILNIYFNPFLKTF